MVDKGLEKFKQIYKDKFGEDLSDAETERIATRIINLYLVIYGERLGLPHGNTSTQVSDAESNATHS